MRVTYTAFALAAVMFVGCSAPLRDADDAGPCAMSAPTVTRCAGECVDTASDRRHCGGCGYSCRAGFACVDGQCSDACASGFLSCNGECVDPQTDARFCGASLDCAGSNAGRACSRVEQCVNGLCAYFESPHSEVTPYASASEFQPISVPRPVALTINSVLSGRVHYTLDGTDPRPGSASTTSASLPATITVGGSDGVTVALRWYVEYGGFYDREPNVQQRLIRVSSGAEVEPNAITEQLTFNGTPGTILVDRGTPVTVHVRVQRWRQSPMWWCPGCVITQFFAVDTTETTTTTIQRTCSELAVPTYPGEADVDVTFNFTAPMARGRYAVRYGITPDFPRNCPRIGGGAPIAFYYVR